MINGVIGTSLEGHVDGRDSDKVLEGGKVTAAAEGVVGAAPDVKDGFVLAGGDAGGVEDFLGGGMDEVDEERVGGYVEMFADGADVEVEVGHGVFVEVVPFVFDPFGGP